MDYKVKTFREKGFAARWTKTKKGVPIIAIRKAEIKAGKWYLVNKPMFKAMENDGIKEAFESHTALGGFFSIAI